MSNNIGCGFADDCNTPSKHKGHIFTHFRNDFQNDYKLEISKWERGSGNCIEEGCSSKTKNKYDFSRHYFSKHVYETYVPASSADSSFQNPNQDPKPIELKNGTITSNIDEEKIEKVSSIQHPNNESKEELKNDDITKEIVQNEPKNRKCDPCGRKFSSSFHLERHIFSVHEKRRHNCTECAKSFTQIYPLKAHMIKEHKKNLSNNQTEVMKSMEELKNDTVNSIIDEVIISTIQHHANNDDSKEESKNDDIIAEEDDHDASQNKIKLDESSTSASGADNNIKLFPCEKCSMKFETKSKLNYHNENKSKKYKTPLKCNQNGCDFKSCKPNGLTKHKKNYHAIGGGNGNNSTNEDEEVFKVEKLLRKRIVRKQVQYFVKWLGYDETSWEPEDNIHPGLIQAFENGNGSSGNDEKAHGGPGSDEPDVTTNSIEDENLASLINSANLATKKANSLLTKITPRNDRKRSNSTQLERAKVKKPKVNDEQEVSKISETNEEQLRLQRIQIAQRDAFANELLREFDLGPLSAADIKEEWEKTSQEVPNISEPNEEKMEVDKEVNNEIVSKESSTEENANTKVLLYVDPDALEVLVKEEKTETPSSSVEQNDQNEKIIIPDGNNTNDNVVEGPHNNIEDDVDQNKSSDSETKTCLICIPNETVSKDLWFRHLNTIHFVHEFQHEIDVRLKEDVFENWKCWQCDFSCDERKNLAKHIVKAHGNEISEKLYANAVDFGNLVVHKEPEDESFKAEAPEGEDHHIITVNSSTTTTENNAINNKTEEMETTAAVNTVENFRKSADGLPVQQEKPKDEAIIEDDNHSDSDNTITPETQTDDVDYSDDDNASKSENIFLFPSAADSVGILTNMSSSIGSTFQPPSNIPNYFASPPPPSILPHEQADIHNEVFEVKPVFDKLTTKIRLKLLNQENARGTIRAFKISKSHIKLRDVKEFLDQQRFFKFIKSQTPEFHVKEISDEGEVEYSKIENDDQYLRNINGVIVLECWF